MSLNESSSGSRSAAAAEPSEAQSVLIADDDDSLREQLHVYLSSRGIRCLLAETGARALQVLRQHRPAVVVLDIRLPDANGMELAARIAAMTPRPRIILMSGYDDAVIEASKAELDVFALIEKPVPLRIVARSIDQALNRAA